MKVYTVSEISKIIKQTLETNFPEIKVSGEISGFKLHLPSGHIYFNLKDEISVLPAILYAYNTYVISKLPELFGLSSLKEFAEISTVEKSVNGRKVTLTGPISAYQGRYQIQVKDIELEGLGELYKKFEELKEKLKKRGWFDESRKKPLPLFPERIGVVTSTSGAAIRDILNITKRRWNSVHILIYPAIVQGENAADSITKGINFFNKHKNVDVIIAGRGGGSIEDLWAFNEEKVAQAIFESEIPVVSAVGHETDFTIADFVADLRAPTPSAAAELVLKNTKTEIKKRVHDLTAKLFLKIKELININKQFLDHFPNQRLKKDLIQNLTNLKDKLKKRLSVEKMARELSHLVLESETKFELIKSRFSHSIENILKNVKERYKNLLSSLNLLNPLNILKRGYSITQIISETEPKIITDTSTVNEGEKLLTTLAKGKIISVIERKEK